MPSKTMRAMLLDAPGRPLRPALLPVPEPAGREILVRVSACAVCRTDLHIVDGELAPHLLPLVPGHEIAGVVAALGAQATRFAPGARVGVPWLGGGEVATTVVPYALEAANAALADLRGGRIDGAAVLLPALAPA